MQYINNDDALTLAIQDDLNDVVYKMTEEIVEMIKESILTIVYEPYEPSIYNRQFDNGGFYDSWINSEVDISSGMNQINLLSEVFSDAGCMTYDPRRLIHGSDSGGDRREIMDAAIAEGTDYDIDTGEGWWQEPRDYWSPVIDMLDARRHFQILFEKNLREKGINFKRVGGL